MTTTDLPIYPTKGHRRRLDQLWLTKLHLEGFRELLTSTPEPPPELATALAEYNSGQFWECHETLEALWLPEPYPLRLFYHGMIKAAVGMLHLQRRNGLGARLKLADAVYTLAPFVPGIMGIDVARLHTDTNQRLSLVQEGHTLDWKAIEGLPPVQIHRF